MNLRKQIVFITLIIIASYHLPIASSFEATAGQLQSNVQALSEFKLVLWRDSPSDANLPISTKLSEITIQPDGSFSTSPDSKDFSLLLIPLNEKNVSPIIMYDFKDRILVRKTVLSNAPQTNYSLLFQSQNNAISPFVIRSYFNSYRNLLLKGETFTVESQGVLISLPPGTDYSKQWLQEAQLLNAKNLRLQSYARDNSERLNKSEFIAAAVLSLSLAEIPTYLQQVKAIQLNRDNFSNEEIDSLYTQMTEINWNIFQTNKMFSSRITSLVLSLNSLIDQNIRLIETTIDSKIAAELKIRQEAEAKAKAIKKVTITCVMGKLSKKVTAAKPKCPVGYKKK